MNIHNSLLKSFTKLFTDKEEPKQNILYGTAVVNDTGKYVKIDGSGELTPIVEANELIDGDRVSLVIENHEAVVTGNITAPASARTATNYFEVNESGEITVTEDLQNTLDDLMDGRIETNEVIAKKADIETLIADSAVIKNLEAEKANVSELTAATARIGSLESNTIKTDDISANTGSFHYLSTDQLNASYAKIDMSNTNNSWIENGVIKNGSISDAMINTVSANKLTAGTIDASKITVTNLNADNLTVGTINGARIGNSSIDLSKLSEEVPTKEYLDSVEEKLQLEIDGSIETFTTNVIPTLQNNPAIAWTTNELKDKHVGDICYVINPASNADGYCYRFAKSNNIYSWVLIKDSDVTAALKDVDDIKTFNTTVSSYMTNNDEEMRLVKTRTTTIETTYSTKDYVDDQSSTTLTSAQTYADTKKSEAISAAASDATTKANTAKTEAISSANTSMDTKLLSYTTTSDMNSAINTAKSEAISTASSDASLKASAAEDNAKKYADSEVSRKVDTTVFSELKDTVDEISTSITSMSSIISTKADGSTVETLSNTVNTVSQEIGKNTETIKNLTTTVSTKADGSTVSTLSNKVNTIEDTVDGHSTSISSLNTTVANKADSSTVSTLSNKVNSVEETVSGITRSITDINETVSTKADGSTVSTLSNKVNTIEDTVDGHSTSISSLNTTVATKADGSTVSTLSNKVTNVESNLDGFKTTVSNTYQTKDAMSAYPTTQEMNSAISQSASEITISVNSYTDSSIESELEEFGTDMSNTYQTKDAMSNYTTTSDMNTAIGTAKSEAISSANSSTDTKLQSYTTTSGMNAAIGTAKSEAISTAASDATTKANSAKEAAITVAADAIKSMVSGAGGTATYTQTNDSFTWNISGNMTKVTDSTARTNASNAAKTATNYMSYDATNGLLIGDRSSGTLSGFRTSIKNDGMDIINNSGESVAHYGSSTWLGSTSKHNIEIDSEGKLYARDVTLYGNNDNSVVTLDDSMSVVCNSGNTRPELLRITHNDTSMKTTSSVILYGDGIGFSANGIATGEILYSGNGFSILKPLNVDTLNIKGLTIGKSSWINFATKSISASSSGYLAPSTAVTDEIVNVTTGGVISVNYTGYYMVSARIFSNTANASYQIKLRLYDETTGAFTDYEDLGYPRVVGGYRYVTTIGLSTNGNYRIAIQITNNSSASALSISSSGVRITHIG